MEKVNLKIRDLAVPTVNLGELLKLDPSRDGGFWRDEADEAKAWATSVLTRSLRFAVNGVEYVVPAGFMTDHASVPWFFSWLYPRRGRRYEVAAVVHDFLYSVPTGMDRAAADLVFRAAMRALGVPAYRALILWAAVRVGGGGAWDEGQRRGASDPLWRVLRDEEIQ